MEVFQKKMINFITLHLPWGELVTPGFLHPQGTHQQIQPNGTWWASSKRNCSRNLFTSVVWIGWDGSGWVHSPKKSMGVVFLSQGEVTRCQNMCINIYYIYIITKGKHMAKKRWCHFCHLEKMQLFFRFGTRNKKKLQDPKNQGLSCQAWNTLGSWLVRFGLDFEPLKINRVQPQAGIE